MLNVNTGYPEVLRATCRELHQGYAAFNDWGSREQFRLVNLARPVLHITFESQGASLRFVNVNRYTIG